MKNVFKLFWKKLEELRIFEKFVRIRTALIVYIGGGLLVAYIIIMYLLTSGILLVETKIVDKQTRDKEIKVEKEKVNKYDKIAEENKSLKSWKEAKVSEYYKMDLVFRLYEYYKNMGLLQRYYWISRKVFEEVYSGAVNSKDLCPSFDKYYFKVFPAEESAIKTIVIRRNPKISGENLEKLIEVEKKKYLDLIYPIVIYGECKKESNFDKRCESPNFKKDVAGNYILDKNKQKIFKSVDQGILQINYCGMCGGDFDKCVKLKNKPIGEGYCTRAKVERILKSKKPNIASRDIFDIEKNLSLRAIHTEDLIVNKESWLFIDWDFFSMCRRIMWEHYYPEMKQMVD